jgi:hypothetical protein
MFYCLPQSGPCRNGATSKARQCINGDEGKRRNDVPHARVTPRSPFAPQRKAQSNRPQSVIASPLPGVARASHHYGNVLCTLFASHHIIALSISDLSPSVRNETPHLAFPLTRVLALYSQTECGA